MTDPLDIDLQDAELVDEIALVTELMAAAAQAPDQLSQDAVDGILRSQAVAH